MAGDIRNNKRNNGNKNDNVKRYKRPKHPDPLSTPTLRGWEGLKLLREMARGKFDMYNKGHLFRDLNFVRDTIVECQKQYAEAYMYWTALYRLYQTSEVEDPMLVALIEKNAMKMQAYNLCIEQLANIMNYKDTGYLNTLMNHLPNYRKYI